MIWLLYLPVYINIICLHWFWQHETGPYVHHLSILPTSICTGVQLPPCQGCLLTGLICHTSFLAVACVRNHLFCIMGSYYTKLRSDVLALQHAQQLCECPTVQQRLLYRHSLAELDDLLCKEKENTADSKVRKILLPYLSLPNAVCFMRFLALMSLCLNSSGQCSLVWGAQGICNFGTFNSVSNSFLSLAALC